MAGHVHSWVRTITLLDRWPEVNVFLFRFMFVFERRRWHAVIVRLVDFCGCIVTHAQDACGDALKPGTLLPN
jgi:hypothetical protein